MTSPSFPGALDALANPGPTTETDDTGYELDVVVARLQNCVMAIEQKLGIGTSAPSVASVLRRTAGSATAWGQLAAGDIAPGAIATADLAANAATGVKLWMTGPPTLAGPINISNAYVTFLGPSASVTLTAGSTYLCIAKSTLQTSTTGTTAIIRMRFGSTVINTSGVFQSGTAGLDTDMTAIALTTALSGTNTFDLQFAISVGAGTLQAPQGYTDMIVVELKK